MLLSVVQVIVEALATRISDAGQTAELPVRQMSQGIIITIKLMPPYNHHIQVLSTCTVNILTFTVHVIHEHIIVHVLYMGMQYAYTMHCTCTTRIHVQQVHVCTLYVTCMCTCIIGYLQVCDRAQSS